MTTSQIELVGVVSRPASSTSQFVRLASRCPGAPIVDSGQMPDRGPPIVDSGQMPDRGPPIVDSGQMPRAIEYPLYGYGYGVLGLLSPEGPYPELSIWPRPDVALGLDPARNCNPSGRVSIYSLYSSIGQSRYRYRYGGPPRQHQ